MTPRIVRTLIVLLATASFAGAQTPPTVNVDRRVFIDVDQATPHQVLGQLAESIGCRIELDPKVSQLDVTLRLSNVRARTALDAVCDMVGCRWSLRGATLVVTSTAVPPPVPAERQFVDRLKLPLAGMQWKLDRVPLRDVLKRLSDEIGADVTFPDADPSSSITDDLRGRSPMDAFGRIQGALGYASTGMSGTIRGKNGRNEIRLEGRRQTEPRSEPPARVHESSEPGLTLPTVISSVRPQYTRSAMQAKIQGSVVIAAVVNETGAVEDAHVVTPLAPELDAQAIRAAKQWRFSPGTKDGKPVAVRITLDMAFTLR